MASTAETLTGKRSYASSEEKVNSARPYWNPYIAGIGLGLALLAAFVIMGKGIGASGAYSKVISVGINTAAPAYAAHNDEVKGYLNDDSSNSFKDYLIFEALGIFAGGFLSGFLGHRIKRKVEKGPRITVPGRFVYAFIGGGLVGIGTRLARGCTSGQALTGGAILNLGSWVFMISIFIGAYALAYFVRRLWI